VHANKLFFSVLFFLGHGPWAMGHAHGPWPMAHGPWPIDHGPWPIDHGPWPMGNGPSSQGLQRRQPPESKRLMACGPCVPEEEEKKTSKASRGCAEKGVVARAAYRLPRLHDACLGAGDGRQGAPSAATWSLPTAVTTAAARLAAGDHIGRIQDTPNPTCGQPHAQQQTRTPLCPSTASPWQHRVFQAQRGPGQDPSMGPFCRQRFDREWCRQADAGGPPGPPAPHLHHCDVHTVLCKVLVRQRRQNLHTRKSSEDLRPGWHLSTRHLSGSLVDKGCPQVLTTGHGQQAKLGARKSRGRKGLVQEEEKGGGHWRGKKEQMGPGPRIW